MPPIAKFLKEKCKYCKFLIYKNLVLVYNKGRIVRTRSSEYILRDYLMRKFPKTLLTIFTAAVMSAGAISLAACDASFTPADGIPSGEVSSNGGFVVEKGDYVYFINGVESSSSDNTYGSVVKGALMRAKKSDVESGKNGAEMIVPSLMVASDYTAGIFIYGERVYFATPSTTRDLSGNALNSYLDFKSAKLDGSDVVTYFNLEDSSTYYRFVEDGNSVYLVYERENDIISYNTSTKTSTLLAADVTSYAFDKSDATNPVIYYTMSVQDGIDVEGGASARQYNQIYRVSAGETEGKYTYTFNEDYLKEHDNEAPYTNLGEMVLDGIGMMYTGMPTQFSEVTGHLKDADPIASAGYSFTLQSYQNGGLYFTRNELASTSSVGEDGWLYYLNEDKLAGEWNSVSGNAVSNLDVIDQNTDHANEYALFYIENDRHHYLYVDNGNMFRVDITESTANGSVSLSKEETLVARNATDAGLIAVDDSDSAYHYVYYTLSSGSGTSINRAVYNGTADDYSLLGYGENEAFRPVQILNIEHANNWYDFEVIDGVVYFADAESIGSSSYNYISAVNLKNADGVMDNLEVKAFNDLYADIMGGGEKTGYISEMGQDYSSLATALRYYFYLGKDNLFYAAAENLDDYDFELSGEYLTYESSLFRKNIDFAVENGKKETYLYSEEVQELFRNYVEGKGDSAEFVADGESYRTRSYFINRIGQMSEADAQRMASYWEEALEHYHVPEETDSGLPGWAWALIGVGIGVVVLAIAIVIGLVWRKKHAPVSEEEEKIFVDTTDDKDIDVYADNGLSEENEVAEASAAEVSDSDDVSEKEISEGSDEPKED